MTTEVLSEAEKMRRVPGIHFADTPAGRVATLDGTGLGVWEIMKGQARQGWSLLSTRGAFHWLTPRQFRAAITYYATFPDEVDERLALEGRYTPEEVYRMYPFTRPKDVSNI